MLHVARHLMGLDIEDKMVRTLALQVDADTEALVSAGRSLKDEYVGVIGRLKSVGSRVRGRDAGPATQRGETTPSGPVYTTRELIAAQRIQMKWRKCVKAQTNTRRGLPARQDRATGMAQWT